MRCLWQAKIDDYEVEDRSVGKLFDGVVKRKCEDRWSGVGEFLENPSIVFSRLLLILDNQSLDLPWVAHDIATRKGDLNAILSRAIACTKAYGAAEPTNGVLDLRADLVR